MAGFLGKIPQFLPSWTSSNARYRVIGTSTPVFDIGKHYQPDDVQDLLVRDVRTGDALASCFSEPNPGHQGSKSELSHSVVLMRGHGFTTVAASTEECILRAIYTQENATIQTTSLALNATHTRVAGSTNAEVHYLSEGETVAATSISQSAWSRAWTLWTREVQASNLYVYYE